MNAVEELRRAIVAAQEAIDRAATLIGPVWHEREGLRAAPSGEAQEPSGGATKARANPPLSDPSSAPQERSAPAQSDRPREPSLELTPEEAAALFRWMHEPPNECEHGFTLPADCPNAECDDRVVAALWYRLAALHEEQGQ